MISASITVSATLYPLSLAHYLPRRAEGSQVAETIRKAHDRSYGFSSGRSDVRIHSLGYLHIGGAAYVVWALPPKVGGIIQRHVQVHNHTTASLNRQPRREASYARESPQYILWPCLISPCFYISYFSIKIRKNS
jgi:hypothetical protein